ncbi:MAG: class I adenylate-forming enzyme family protein [Pseudomonadota bacterium]
MILRGEPLAEPFPLGDLLKLGLSKSSDEEALMGPTGSWTWRQLDRATTALAGNYRRLGLAPGDRVASLMPEDPATILHYVACLKAGLVITTLHYRSAMPFVDQVLAETEASALLYHAERQAEIEQLAEAGRLAGRLIRYGDPSAEGHTLETMLDSATGEDLPDNLSNSLNALIIYTSGSTGAPKGVVHTRETLGWIVSSLQQTFGLTEEDRFLSTSALSFSVGTKYNFSVLAAGGSVVVGRSSDLDEILDLMRQRRPTFTFVLSPICLPFFQHVHPTAADFESLRAFVIGGDKASRKLKADYHALTGRFMRESFGMTEISSSIIGLDRAIPEDAIGKAVAGYEVAVRDKDGKILPAGQTGELTFRSKTVMVGYWKRPDATAEVLKDGWLYTGDIVSADEEGYIYFKGRSKQLILHDAANISPQEVEESLVTHPSVTSAAVVGVLDPHHGEAVWAFVTVDPAVERPAERELVQYSKDQLGWRAAENVIIVPTLPTTPIGKIDRTKVKEMAGHYPAH